MTEPLTTTAATPAPDGGSGTPAGVVATGTPQAAAGGNAGGETPEQELQRLREQTKLLAGLEQKAALVNDLQTRIAELEGQGRTTAPPAADPKAQDEQMRQDVATLEAIANDPANPFGPIARVQLANLGLARTQMVESQIDSADGPCRGMDKAQREAVRGEIHSGRFRDVEAAARAVRGDSLSTREQELATREADLKKREEALAAQATSVASAAVGTGAAIPVPARAVQAGALSEAEFNAQHQKLMDAKRFAEARALAAAYNAGKGGG